MLIARSKEVKILTNAAKDEQSHFIAIYGRRRIGKTYLVRETFGERFTFQHAGLSNGGMKEQLFAFNSSLKDYGFEGKKLNNWLEAFECLKDLIRESKEKKKIIFIDELSWMDTPKSDLMVALENFWNGFASARKDVVLIVCASATSWMLSNIVHNKGGLYNRLTEQIHLSSFSLKDCEEYVESKNLVLNREQILQFYMIFGGIPYYWGFLEKGKSLSQNIDHMLFEKDAPLRQEFQYLYASIFKRPEKYTVIIEALATKKAGMTREELIKEAHLTNSGGLTTRLEELESCGFIRCYYSFEKKKKNAIYQLMDSFTLFYYQFLKEYPTDEHFWSGQMNTPKVNTWTGLAFERVCFMHIEQIKEKLGIARILTEVKSWNCKKDEEQGIFGSQIDMLIIRKDQIINLCEMKYSDAEYSITAKVDESLRHKISDLKNVTKTKYAIHPVLVTTYGLVENKYSSNIQEVVTLDDLFK